MRFEMREGIPMTVKQWQRREQLRGELNTLVGIVVDYYAECPSGTVENPFIDHLEQKMREKTEELEFLNALYDDPKERRELEAEQLLQDPNMKSTLMVVVVVALVSIALLLVFWLGP